MSDHARLSPAAGRTPGSRRGFSVAELLIALMISSMLLTATLGALDGSFKAYKATTESASSHVIARMVMHRMTTMIRTGEDFGPYPINPILDPVLTPDPPEIEFVVDKDEASGFERVIRIERRDTTEEDVYALWYVQTDLIDGVQQGEAESYPLLTNVQNVTFTLHYDVGPRLQHATIDLTIRPDDLNDAAIAANLESASMRLVTTVSPRRTD
ncbi:MAG: prepilin-type N-terminal cleavage/methylation domain-containing protein [Planctomycetota bacterium]|nr:MAG: prepilin-type N-terminal cleavage/methylation domain-containing protein [Planctomycetota bacterium]